MVSYSHDTRTLQPGQYYVAIRGERHDGHRFIPDALAKGARGLVVAADATLPPLPPEVAVVRAPDTELYLAEQARARLHSLGTQVVAVTGSVGKTTTKGAVVAVLQQAHTVVTPQGNWNSLLGLSLTILNHLTRPEELFVTEIGIYYAGEITHVCQYVAPTVGVVVNVQPVHLDTMGTIENIAQAKGELVACLPPHGTACLNADDERVRAMASRCAGSVLLYGEHPTATVRRERITSDIPLAGTYRTSTALAAVAVGQVLGMDDAQINAGIRQIRSEKGRLVTLPGRAGCTLIDDTYNASRASTAAALAVLASRPVTRRVACLGDMLELGSTEAEAHRAMVQQAQQTADMVVLVGSRYGQALHDLGIATGDTLHHYPVVEDAVAALAAGTLPIGAAGDCVLVKGSAGIRMERLLVPLLRPDVDAAAVLARQGAAWQ